MSLRRISAWTVAALAFSSPALAAPCESVESKVCAGSPKYDPSHVPGSKRYASPTCATRPDVSNAAQSIQRAFQMAPDKIKTELCALKRIFVVDRAYSWGLWENAASDEFPTDGAAAGSYIGLRAKGLDLGLDKEEDEFLKSALHKNALPGMYGHSSGPDRYNKDLGVLAALVHELGHIAWHRDNARIVNATCFAGDFIEATWEPSTIGPSLRSTWANTQKTHGAAHRKNGPQSPGKDKLTGPELYAIYGSFATAAGGATPEEDFVEAMKIVALRNARLQDADGPGADLRITVKKAVPGEAQSTLDLLGSRAGIVEKKLACAKPYVM